MYDYDYTIEKNTVVSQLIHKLTTCSNFVQETFTKVINTVSLAKYTQASHYKRSFEII